MKEERRKGEKEREKKERERERERDEGQRGGKENQSLRRNSLNSTIMLKKLVIYHFQKSYNHVQENSK